MSIYSFGDFATSGAGGKPAGGEELANIPELNLPSDSSQAQLQQEAGEQHELQVDEEGPRPKSHWSYSSGSLTSPSSARTSLTSQRGPSSARMSQALQPGPSRLGRVSTFDSATVAESHDDVPTSSSATPAPGPDNGSGSSSGYSVKPEAGAADDTAPGQLSSPHGAHHDAHHDAHPDAHQSDTPNLVSQPEANNGQPDPHTGGSVKPSPSGQAATPDREEAAPAFEPPAPERCCLCDETLESARAGGRRAEKKVYMPCGHFVGDECYFRHVKANKPPYCPTGTDEAPCIVLMHGCGHKHFPSLEPPAAPFRTVGADYLTLKCTWCRDIPQGVGFSDRADVIGLKLRMIASHGIRAVLKSPELWAVEAEMLCRRPVYRVQWVCVRAKMRLKHHGW